ncbi:hypothetical protein C817_02144 [Dorea sp. 5-2]|nr:hypothetical protein C817_02144 [Dorea sp. 5-2]
MKEKMLSFGNGEEAVEVVITVSSYKVGERLYVGLFSRGEGGLEPFSNLTINLPYSPAGVNEGYIERNDCKNLMEFIERHKLGRILPEKGYSGYAEYAKAAFDLDRLAEYDPAGVEEYRSLHGIKGKEQAEEKDWEDKAHRTVGKDWTSKKKRGLER